MPVTVDDLARGCPRTPRARLVECVEPLNESLRIAEITTPLRLAHYLSQVTHESLDLLRFEENLNYSAEALFKTWPKHFPGVEFAQRFAHDPRQIANRAYADRMGNGSEDSGEGWKFRGRGGLQSTGFDAYRRLQTETGIVFLSDPDLLATPRFAFVGAAKVWQWKGLNMIADRDDVDSVSHKINGGSIGLENRRERLASWKAVLA